MIRHGWADRTTRARADLRDRGLGPAQRGGHLVGADLLWLRTAAEDKGGEIATDRRGLTPLFWQHVQPYGEVRPDVARRLQLGDGADAAKPGGPV
ncbi:hypothetical protein ABZ860_38675 [Microbispora sp. NPDC046973]|uniref:hypothetical protein n=1 Tax=Microbispora sp. NPDC046973 TaxID=3155022 RepID=UPI0033CD704A